MARQRHSLFTQHEIKHPTSTHMRPRPSAVAQDFLVIATGFVQGVSQDGHSVESTVVVDRLGQLDDGGRKPYGVERYGAEGVAEDVTEQVGLNLPFDTISHRTSDGLRCGA